jgi:hypothetical protein
MPNLTFRGRLSPIDLTSLWFVGHGLPWRPSGGAASPPPGSRRRGRQPWIPRRANGRTRQTCSPGRVLAKNPWTARPAERNGLMLEAILFEARFRGAISTHSLRYHTSAIDKALT